MVKGCKKQKIVSTASEPEPKTEGEESPIATTELEVGGCARPAITWMPRASKHGSYKYQVSRELKRAEEMGGM